MKRTREQVLFDLEQLPAGYKTADVDRLIRAYVKEKADVSALRPHILKEQQLHRIYYYVTLKQQKDVLARMAVIHENLLFSDWWHTDQLIHFVADLPMPVALKYAGEYVQSKDPFIRRWGYVLFISRLGRGHAAEILPLMKQDDAYYVQMAEGWLLAELAIREPQRIYDWLRQSDLSYSITGKAVQKILDSFRISEDWKAKFRALRPELRERV